MKNKKLLLLLIPCTLILWGMILYKIFSAASAGNDGMESNQTMFVTEKPNTLILTDTFSIHPNYRDPFLGKIAKTYTQPGTTTESSMPVKPAGSITNPKISNTIPFPTVIYSGLIKNNQSNKQLVLIQIDGQSTIMKLGETFNEVQLTKVFKDSIEVKFQKQKRYIRK